MGQNVKQDDNRPPPASGADPAPGDERQGSDPPKDSGQPAARRAGDGDGAARPASPSEIDRSTDA